MPGKEIVISDLINLHALRPNFKMVMAITECDIGLFTNMLKEAYGEPYAEINNKDFLILVESDNMSFFVNKSKSRMIYGRELYSMDMYIDARLAPDDRNARVCAVSGIWHIVNAEFVDNLNACINLE